MATRNYTREEVMQIVVDAAKRHGIPKDDFLRASFIETGGQFNERASNPSGAKGLFQFMPETAREYGIQGREFDPNASADAAARLYLNNQSAMVRHHERTGQPYLSGEPNPTGLDMYFAHQQGNAGYRSIQAALQTGSFERQDTRRNILANISPTDARAITGHTMTELRAMPDGELAKNFVKYWDTKYDRISIPEQQISPRTGAATEQARTAPAKAIAAATAAASDAVSQSSDDIQWPTPGNRVINRADKPREGKGEFGTPRSNRSGIHTGIDIQGQVGDPIRPYKAGTVLFAGRQADGGGFGNYIVIEHKDGTQTVYAHLDTMSVKAGDPVTLDQTIGTMGRSGNTPRRGDTHLHFELRENAKPGVKISGTPVDPLPRLQGLEPRAQLGGAQSGDAGVPVEFASQQAIVKQAVAQRLSSLGYNPAQIDSIAGALSAANAKDGELLSPDTRFFVGKDGQRVAAVYASGIMREVEISGALEKAGLAHLQGVGRPAELADNGPVIAAPRPTSADGGDTRRAMA